jgi:hypothetical protein
MGGVNVLPQAFLTSALVGEWLFGFTPRPLYPRERAPGIHSVGDCVGPRTGLERNKSCPLPVVQPVAGHYTDCATPALGVRVANENRSYRWELPNFEFWADIPLVLSETRATVYRNINTHKPRKEPDRCWKSAPAVSYQLVTRVCSGCCGQGMCSLGLYPNATFTFELQ